MHSIPCSIGTISKAWRCPLSVSGFQCLQVSVDPQSGIRGRGGLTCRTRSGLPEGERLVLSVVQASFSMGLRPFSFELPEQPRPRVRDRCPPQVRGAGGARGGRNRAWLRTRGGFPERQWNSEVAPDLGPDGPSFQRDPARCPPSVAGRCPPPSPAVLRAQTSAPA